MARVQYEQLCNVGKRIDAQARETAARLVEVIRILQDSEETYPERVDRYRGEVRDLRHQRRRDDATLMQHVAHCAAGCKRVAGGNAAFAGENQPGVYRNAPAHAKPELPRSSELAAMIEAGATLDDLAAKYERHKSTIAARLRDAGYGARPAIRNTSVLALFVRKETRAWIADALCAQIDAEMFFPEKGGSTREAKAVCARCPVQAECLDDALANNERFGIWGGVSERTRRRINESRNPSTTENTQEAS